MVTMIRAYRKVMRVVRIVIAVPISLIVGIVAFFVLLIQVALGRAIQ